MILNLNLDISFKMGFNNFKSLADIYFPIFHKSTKSLIRDNRRNPQKCKNFLIVAGSSQISKWTAFVLNLAGDDIILWDPEIGDHYKLSDSRCSLIKVSRLINHSGVSIKKLN